jgi:hypothetical protein
MVVEEKYQDYLRASDSSPERGRTDKHTKTTRQLQVTLHGK